MPNYVFASGCLFNSETEEATTDRSYGRSALLAFVKNCGSGAEVRFFAFLILMHKGLYRIASLLLQDYQNC
jgi:hypothetical protein